MHIGDLLLVTPVLRTLRTNFPHAHISLLADAKLADLVRLNHNIDELITIDKKGYHDKFLNYMRFIGEIRHRNFDLVINLHKNERASFIAALSGAKKIVGYSTFGPRLLFDKTIENRKRSKHQVHAHFDVLKETLGITNIDDRGIEMWLDEAAEATAAAIWSQAFPDIKPVIGLNIGASWPTKRWPKEYFAKLADRLVDHGFAVAYFGGPMDVEIVDQAIGLMKHKDHPQVVKLTGKVSLMELAALLKKCTVFVTNDSGPMHIATAMNIPLVSMFGASPVEGFWPYNDISIVMKTPLSCHPCYKHTCKLGGLECMYAITVDQVFATTLSQVKLERHNQPKWWEKKCFQLKPLIK